MRQAPRCLVMAFAGHRTRYIATVLRCTLCTRAKMSAARSGITAPRKVLTVGTSHNPRCASVFYNEQQASGVIMSQSNKRLPPSGMNGSDVLAGRLAHGAESSSGAQDASTSTNFDDFDFDALGITTPHPLDGEDVSSPAARGVSFQPVPTHSRSSSRGSDDSGLNFLSTMKKTQVEMRLEKMRAARKNRFSSMSLQSEDSQRSIGSGPRIRRSFFQALSERTPLIVRILALRVMLHCLTM